MQEISFVQLVVFGYGVVLPILGYFLKGVMDQVKEQDRQLNTLHEKYVKKDDFKVFEDRLWLRLDRIEDKLDGKPNG